MIKLNIFLFLVLVVCALGVVTAQHEARKLFIAQERERDQTEQLKVEWNQLRLEQSTLAMSARVEKIARKKLDMVASPPVTENILVIRPVSQFAGETR